MGVRSFALFCLALFPSAAFASSLDSTSCNAPWQPFGSGVCPAPADININNYVSNKTTVTPIRNPTVDRNDYAHLVPSIDASLFYSDAKGTEQLAAVLNFTMNYPTVIVENSAYVSGCKCTDSSIVTLVFSDKQAFSYTQQWPTSDFVLITDAPGCSSQPDERGVYLISSITSNPLRHSVVCKASPKKWEDVSDTLEIGFGRTGQAGKSGKNVQAETRTATRHWTADGELTSSVYITTMVPARFTKTTTASSLRSTSLGYYHRPQQHNATQTGRRGSSSTSPSAGPSSSNSGTSAWSPWSQTSRMPSSSSSSSPATHSSTSSTARKTRSGSTTAYTTSNTVSSSLSSGLSSSYSTSTGEPSSLITSIEEFSSTKTSINHSSSTRTSSVHSSSTTTSSGQSSVTAETSSSAMSSTLATTSESLSTITSTRTASTTSESTSTTSATNTSSTNASTSSSSSSSTSTIVTSTTSSAAESTSATSTDGTSSTSILTTSSTSTESTTIMYSNSTSTTSATTTTSADDSLPTLSPRAREIYNEIMSVLTINEDGYMVITLPDNLAKQTGQAETAPFDPWNEEDQLRWQQEMIDLGFSFGEDILNEVTASLDTAAGQEFTTMPDPILTDTEPEGYVRSEMIDRASLPEDTWEENSWELNAEIPPDIVEGEEDVDDGGRSEGRLPTSAEDEIDQNEETSGEDKERETPAKRTKRYSSRHTIRSLHRRDDDDDWWDYVSGFGWNFLGFLGDMGCDVCSIAAKAKDLFDDLSGLKEAMEEVRSRQPALASGSWDGSLYINVPAQTLVETWDGPELSCSDASIQVSSLLIEAKMVVSLKDQRVVMGEVVTSLTSKSNLQFQFQSRDSIEGWWTFTTSTLNLDTVEAPGIFKISPRFYYNFGARYWVRGTGTIEAGATTEVTNARATIDIVDKKVKDGYSNWKPSNINLKYPNLQSWQAANLEPYYRSSLVIDLDVFGNRYSDAIVVNQETWIGYTQGRVYMTESRQCQRRDMKLLATARTTNTISVIGGEKTDLFSENWDIAARCFTPAGQRPLCPAGVYDGQILDLVTDSETNATHRYKITCGEAIVQDGAWDHLVGYRNDFPYTIEECMQECADMYDPIYWTIPSMPGCKIASWNPAEADFLPGCNWLTSKQLKTIKGYEMAIAKQVEWYEEGTGTFEATIPPDT